MLDLYSNGLPHQHHAMLMFARGAGYKQVPRNFDRIRPDSDTCVIWGTRHLGEVQPVYQRVIVLERGYFNNRLQNYAVGLGGLNGRADFKNKNSPPDRWNAHGPEMSPWKRPGEYLVIMGQVQGDMATEGVNLSVWYQQIYSQLEAAQSLPVYFRPHPARPEHVPGIETIKGPLARVLSHARGVITYNSNSAVDAILDGVPAMAVDDGSMAIPVAARSIDALIDYPYPARQQWAYDLAYAQWTEAEILAGQAWQHINK